ncbi:MAG: M20 family metallopeptidase [Duodenibacillus sp.]|nr:M20 family metallopeptidase [Duodenibacillus sp.]
MSILQNYLTDLEELVNFDSGTQNFAGVTHAAEIMKRHFEALGFTCELVDLGPKAGKGLLARNKPESDVYDVLMNGHLDTVFDDGTAAERPMSVKDDRAFGPGVSDCKSGVLAIYYALKGADPKDLDRLSICVALNPDEETMSPNSNHWLCELAAKAKRVLVFEAARAGGQLVRSRKGSGNYTVNFKGLASHSGNAFYEGGNAIIAAMRFGLAAAALSDPITGTTVNIGVIKGGSVSNIVCPECEVQINVRFWRNEDEAVMHEALLKLADAVWAPRVTQTLVRTGRIGAMPLSDATKDLVEQMTRAAELENVEIGWVDAGGASDGNHMAEMGVPVIDGCGPAGGGFHADSEFLRLDTVEERIRMISRFLSLI